jgi:hypothetical protein
VLFHTCGDEVGIDEGLSRMFYFSTTLHYAIFSFLSILCPLKEKTYAYINVVKRAANSSNTTDDASRNIFKNSYSCSEYDLMRSMQCMGGRAHLPFQSMRIENTQETFSNVSVPDHWQIQRRLWKDMRRIEKRS